MDATSSSSSFSASSLAYSETEAHVRRDIYRALQAVVGKALKPEDAPMSYPPANLPGDLSVSCFLVAKKMNLPPPQAAAKLAAELPAHVSKRGGLVASVVAVGPYLNFSFDRAKFASAVLAEMYRAGTSFGQSKLGKGKNVMVEYFSPNTNKPLTIGHVRNITLGWTVSQLLKSVGYKVTEATLYNDRGIAIAKAMVGYELWGEGKSPKEAGMKPDHFVGSFYVRFAMEAHTNPEFEKKAQKMLRDWEEGDPAARALWQKLVSWTLAGFTETLHALDVGSFDQSWYESELYESGKDLVELGLAKGVFVRGEGGVVMARLEKYGLPDKVVLRSDGTSLYVTQDLYLAQLKAKFQPDISMYVVGSEQDLNLKQLFVIVDLLGIAPSEQFYHLSYGMIRLPSGRIKSREGLAKGTGADDVLRELEELAAVEIRKRVTDIDDAAVTERAKQIALGALKFYILHVDPKTTMIFDPATSIAFTGKTGPYLQYMHARICSVFAKGKIKLVKHVDGEALTDDATFALVKLLAKFPSVVSQAAVQYAPSHVAEYLYQLARAFSVFYEQMPILQAELKQRRARLLLAHNVKVVLASGLALLGIPAPEKM